MPTMSREYVAARRARLIAEGRCIACCQPKGDSPTQRCEPCRATQRQCQKRIYEARRAAGRCYRCGRNPASGGFVNCETCRRGVPRAPRPVEAAHVQA